MSCPCRQFPPPEMWAAKRDDCFFPVPPSWIKLKGSLSIRAQLQMETSGISTKHCEKRESCNHTLPIPHLSLLLSVLFSSTSTFLKKSCIVSPMVNHSPREDGVPSDAQGLWQQQFFSSACPQEPGEIPWLMAFSLPEVISPSL